MNDKNLKPLSGRTKSEQRDIARKGGQKSGESRRKQKLMSQIYADILAEKTGQKKGLDLKTVVRTILQDGGAPAVSMLKEIREATEGNKTTISNPDGSPLIPQKITFEIVDPNDPQHPNSESIPGSSDPGKV